MLSPLDKKLLRDLWRIKGQAIAIALVVAIGVSLLVMMSGLVKSLEETKRAYYERYRLAEVFAPVKRAPLGLLREIEQFPGVASVEGRINGGALIDIPGVNVPIQAQLISLPVYKEPLLNDVYLADGNVLDPARPDQILLLASFARANDISTGDTITATLNGRQREFAVAGLAEAPEFLFTAAPGELIPDDARFAVIWMNRDTLAAAFDLEGAFNETILSLTRTAELPLIKQKLDQLLSRYGAIGAYDLNDQISNRFISDEIKGLKVSQKVVPPIFLLVAAFLLNIVITRMIQSERTEIGLMKAFGYSDNEVSWHYLKFVSSIALVGAALGCLMGVGMGRGLAQVYQQFYKFPFLVFQVDFGTFILGFSVGVAAAMSGGFLGLRQIFGLTPAVAMHPPAPPDYSRTNRLSAGLERLLDQPCRMVLRRLIRQPLRSLSATVGIGAGMSLSVAMIGLMSAFNQSLDLTFNVIDRSDATVSFAEPVSDKALLELQRIEGVISVEPIRLVPAYLKNGLKEYQGGIYGLSAEPTLYRAVNEKMKPIFIRQDGVTLAEPLAEILDIRPGDMLTVEVREGRRPVLELPVVGTAKTMLGSPAFMEIDALNAALKERHRVSGAYLQIDPMYKDQIYTELKNIPTIAGVALQQQSREALETMMNTGAGAMRFIMAGFAAIITFGVVYNSARIAFAERLRDLASLRVLGFTKGETSFVLLGELAVITLLALPIGGLLGYFLSQAVSNAFSTDLYQIPAVFVPNSFGMAALAVILASIASAYFVQRDINRLDLVSALKTRE